MRFSLKEIQSTRTQRPTSGSSYPYVDIMIGDLLNQRITQLQLEQVCVYLRVTHISEQMEKRENLFNTICRTYFTLNTTTICLSLHLCVSVLVGVPGPGAVPSHCHAHG